MNPVLHLTPADWLSMFNHYASLSLLAVGGAITTAPDMHRYLVDESHWLSDSQFTSSIALAQAAPGPNILFVALMGLNVGLNAASGQSGWMGAGLAAARGALARHRAGGGAGRARRSRGRRRRGTHLRAVPDSNRWPMRVRRRAAPWRARTSGVRRSRARD